MPTAAQRVVVCGAGAIGAATALYLARRGVEVVLVERRAVACAASGRAGGFLARDWCAGTPLDALARRSFDLHAALAAELGGWGYRRLTTYGGSLVPGLPARADATLPWLAPDVIVGERLGSPRTTAQVDPAAFTHGLVGTARRHGAELRLGEVTGLRRTPDQVVEGVELRDGFVDADAVVLALGPWSSLVAAWAPLPAVDSLKGHSLVYATGDAIPAEAVFLEYREPGGRTLMPELFPRPDGTTYVSAVGSHAPLPPDPGDVTGDEGAFARLEAVCARLSPLLPPSRVVARQACHRPVTVDGLPLIGPLAGLAGAYVATGHGVWGILNAPATGEALAELVVDGEARSCDLRPFAPARRR